MHPTQISPSTPHQPISLIRKHYAALDGLRGLAILLVFLAHYGLIFLPAALTHSLWFGVDLFFALSGFLITGILYEARGTLHFFRTFYIRRALRIFPIYYGFFLLVFLLTPALHLHYAPITWSFLLYLGNLTLAFHSNPTTIFIGRLHNTVIGLGPLWSLCVEEQFYLLWPWILAHLPNRRAMMRFCAAIVAATLLLRVTLYFHNPAEVSATHYLYFLTFTRWDTLFMGSWLALWLRGVTLTPTQIRRIAYSLLAIPAAILIAGGLTFGRRWPHNEVNPLLCTYGYTLVGLFSIGVLLLALDETSLVHRLLRLRFLSALGVISYGFYFIHGMPYAAVATIHQVVFHSSRLAGFLLSVATFAIVYTLAWLSFRFFESPFLRLKRRFAPTETLQIH